MFTFLTYNRLNNISAIYAILVLFFKVKIKLDKKDYSKIAINLGYKYKGEKFREKKNY